MSKRNTEKNATEYSIPSAEKVQAELAKATSMDDFFGKEGIFAKLFAQTMEELYGVHVSASFVSKVTDKIWESVEAW